ncbi:MAG: CPBP family intramembrane metalloprotease [Phycisphaerae bacterium]|nr:CPBP family intramembrane metalloprotease [Phycisphaerae bacterium]
MDSLEKQTGSTEIKLSGQCCKYCGAELNPAFYFCTVCATPYKAVANVVTAYMPPMLTESELIEQKAPNVWNVFWSYVVMLFVCLIVSVFIDRDDRSMAVFIIFSSIAVSALTVVFAMLYKKSLAVQFKTFGFNSKYAWLGLLMLIPALAINFGYHELITRAVPEMAGESHQGILEILGPTGAFLIICLLPGIMEEIAFRGLIQHWLQVAIKPWRAIILAAALFAALHVNIISFPYLFGLGVLMGWTKYKTGSLYPSILIHILHNFVVITLFQSF